MLKKNKITIIILGILVFGITVGSISFVNHSKSNTSKEGIETKLVDFSNVETEEGEIFNPLDYKDRNLIVTFTNSKCPYCDEQALEFEKLKDEFDFELFYIPTKETTKATSERLEFIGINDYTLLIDRGHELMERIGVKSVPTSLIKRKGDKGFRAVEKVLRLDSEEEGHIMLKNYIN